MKILSLQLILAGLLVLLTSNIGMGKQRTSIALGTEDWPPFSYENKASGQISGLSTEVINATIKLMGVSIKENKVYPWARAQKRVFNGRVDAVYTASINDERKKYCHFPSEPIVTTKWVLFIKKSEKANLSFKELSDLKEKRVGLILGYNYPSQFKEYITENSLIHEVPYETQNIAMLIRGRIEYMPAVLETTLYLAANDPALKKNDAKGSLYYFPTPLATADFHLIFSKKTVKKSFVDKFSNALIEFKKTDEYLGILKKYNHSVATDPKAKHRRG